MTWIHLLYGTWSKKNIHISFIPISWCLNCHWPINKLNSLLCFRNTNKTNNICKQTVSLTLEWWALSLPPRSSKQICATQALVQGSSEQKTRPHQSYMSLCRCSMFLLSRNREIDRLYWPTKPFPQLQYGICISYWWSSQIKINEVQWRHALMLMWCMV